MRFRPLYAVPLALALGVPAFAQSSSPSPSGMMNDSMMHDSKMTDSKMTMSLQPQNGSNETGSVVFSQTPNGLLVNVMTNAAPDGPQPAHIHKGTCANLDPAPAYPLSNVSAGKNAAGKTVGMSSTTIPGVTMAQMMSQPYAVNIHKSMSDVKTYVSCVDIKPAGAMAPSK